MSNAEILSLPPFKFFRATLSRVERVEGLRPLDTNSLIELVLLFLHKNTPTLNHLDESQERSIN